MARGCDVMVWSEGPEGVGRARFTLFVERIAFLAVVLTGLIRDSGELAGFTSLGWNIYLADETGQKDQNPLPDNHVFNQPPGSVLHVWVEPKPGTEAEQRNNERLALDLAGNILFFLPLRLSRWLQQNPHMASLLGIQLFFLWQVAGVVLPQQLAFRLWWGLSLLVQVLFVSQLEGLTLGISSLTSFVVSGLLLALDWALNHPTTSQIKSTGNSAG